MVTANELGAPALIVFAQKRTPVASESSLIGKKFTRRSAQQLLQRHTYDPTRRWISIQTGRPVIENQDSIERVLKNGGEFAVRDLKGGIGRLLLAARVPPIGRVKKSDEAETDKEDEDPYAERPGLEDPRPEREWKENQGKAQEQKGKNAVPKRRSVLWRYALGNGCAGRHDRYRRTGRSDR